MATINENSPDKIEIKGTGNAGVDIERTATTATDQNGVCKEIPSESLTAGYHRSLTRRKVMMMTFGAGIGTGLWVGTGQALHYGMLYCNQRIRDEKY
jgi:amino acid transporter